MKQLVKLVSFVLVGLCAFMLGWLFRKENETGDCGCSGNTSDDEPLININIPELPIKVNLATGGNGCVTCV